MINDFIIFHKIGFELKTPFKFFGASYVRIFGRLGNGFVFSSSFSVICSKRASSSSRISSEIVEVWSAVYSEVFTIVGDYDFGEGDIS